MKKSALVAYITGLLSGSKSVFFIISFLLHIIFFAIIIYAPVSKSTYNKLPAVVDVDISSISVPEPKQDTDQVVKSKKTSQKKVRKKVKKKKALISSPSKRSKAPEVIEKSKGKTSRKKETVREVKETQQAGKPSEADKTPDPMAGVYENLREKVEEDSKGRLELEANEENLKARRNREAFEKQDLYRQEVAFEVQKNWAFPDHLAKGAVGLDANVVFKVKANGEISDIWFEKRSGNNFLDESAYKAIIKANPVGPPPLKSDEDTISIGLRFTPEGVF